MIRVLMADPPWPFNDKLPGAGRGAAKHYPTMTLEALVRYPLPEMADDSVLLLWRVASMQREALDLIDAWRFSPKSEIVWDKRRLCSKCQGQGKVWRRDPRDAMIRIASTCPKCNGVGDSRHFGMGRQVRAGHETCLIATRGRSIRVDASVLSIFRAPVGRHSEKPAEFYSIVERLYPGPYHELFARQRRPGWTSEGNELWASNEAP